MVEVVGATKTQPMGLIDRKMVGDLAQYVLPVLMAALCVLGVTLTVQRAGLLRMWSEDYDGRGAFLVESCAATDVVGADRWLCAGRYSAEGDGVESRSTLATSLGAFASNRPYVGQRFEVFHRTGEFAEVYPLQYRLNEMTRLYLSVLPRLLLAAGSALWLAGWLLTRRIDADDLLARDAVRLPQRFTWRSRGVTWIAVAGLVLGLNHLLTVKVIGSLGAI